jgi:DNA gyrase subunit A
VRLINLRNDDAIAAVAKVSASKEENLPEEGQEGTEVAESNDEE